MIEIIYQGEQETEEQDGELKLPKNVRQIGDLEGETKKIYVEDFVMTFVKHFSSRHLKYGVLLGNTKKHGGNTYLFITGAVCAHPVIDNDIIFDEEVWTGIYEDIKTYFDEVEIVGWFVSMPGMLANDMAELWKLHLDNFAGNDKVCFVLDRVECEDSFYLYDDGGMKKCEGHYIYYAKNGDMQSYMMMHEETSEIPADYEQTSKQAINAKVHRLLYNINTEREPVKKKKKEKSTNALLQAVLTGGQQNKERQEKEISGKAAQEIIENAAGNKQVEEGDVSTEVAASQSDRHRLPVFAFSASSFLLLAILLGAVAVMYASGQLHALRGTVAKMANVGVTDKQGKVTEKTSYENVDDARVIDVEADVTTITEGDMASGSQDTSASEASDKQGTSESVAEANTKESGSETSGKQEASENAAEGNTKEGGNEASDNKAEESTQAGEGETSKNKAEGSTKEGGNETSGKQEASNNTAEESTQAGESETGGQQETAASISPVPSEITYYTVKKGDTLYSISLKVYGNVNRIDDIREANQMDSDEENIAIGQRLVLP